MNQDYEAATVTAVGTYRWLRPLDLAPLAGAA